MHKLPQPVKLWYWGPFFRQERPQAGRYRQFTQVGAEAIGSADPALDAELILLLWEFLEAAGAGKGLHLKLGSLGTPETRATYMEDLTAYLQSRSHDLSEEVRARLHLNPLRAFDADHAGTRAVMAGAPRLLDRLEPEDKEHFQAVCALLDDAEVPYRVDPQLVRGIDYYTRTLFELESDRLGSQSALGGGGRYDGLVEELGGPPTPGVGWAAGIERILLVAEDPDEEPGDRVYVALAKEEAAREAFGLVRRLRALGYRVEMEMAGRSLKGQLKQANRLGVGRTVIAGDGYEVKDMDSGEQVSARTVDEVVEVVTAGGARAGGLGPGASAHVSPGGGRAGGVGPSGTTGTPE
jgi:histidyl-tRNA synthetase